MGNIPNLRLFTALSYSARDYRPPRAVGNTVGCVTHHHERAGRIFRVMAGRCRICGHRLVPESFLTAVNGIQILSTQCPSLFECTDRGRHHFGPRCRRERGTVGAGDSHVAVTVKQFVLVLDIELGKLKNLCQSCSQFIGNSCHIFSLIINTEIENSHRA